LTSSSTSNYAEVLNLLKYRARDLETFTTYAPEQRFITAHVGHDNLSFSVADEDGSVFAMALGHDPIILHCDRLSTTLNVKVDLAKYVHRINWDFYSIDTETFSSGKQAQICTDELEITELLQGHARKSSVWPGNQEVILWGGKRIDGQLVSVGALVKWRTGQVMFASIATHTDYRGKGLAQELVTEMLTSVAAQGISHVGLGVFALNASAKRAYEKVGFNLINEFSSYAIR
jgi:ribosomal protein S18 acetylase RimI-like enzyme